MDCANIEKLLHALGCDKVRVGSTGWVYATCPLAFRHLKGSDAKPSFAISIAPGGASHYKCHACHSVGELPGLIWAISSHYKRDMTELMRLVQVHNVPSPDDLMARLKRINEGGEGKGYKRDEDSKVAGVQVSSHLAASVPKDLKFETLPETALDAVRVVPPDVMGYLLGPRRRLTPESVKQWELGWHPGMRRVAIPIRDSEGALVGISGRAFFDAQMPKYLHSSGFRRDYYLYGEYRVQRGVRGYLCEGFFDVIYLRQMGYNAVAMLGSHLSRFQAEKISKFFSEIVIVPDGDDPGYEAAEKARASLTTKLSTTVAKVPYGKDPDELDNDEMIDILGPVDPCSD